MLRTSTRAHSVYASVPQAANSRVQCVSYLATSGTYVHWHTHLQHIQTGILCVIGNANGVLSNIAANFIIQLTQYTINRSISSADVSLYTW